MILSLPGVDIIQLCGLCSDDERYKLRRMPGLTENVANYAYGISDTVYNDYTNLYPQSQKFRLFC